MRRLSRIADSSSTISTAARKLSLLLAIALSLSARAPDGPEGTALRKKNGGAARTVRNAPPSYAEAAAIVPGLRHLHNREERRPRLPPPPARGGGEGRGRV